MNRLTVVLLVAGCTAPSSTVKPTEAAPSSLSLPAETHLTDVRQLTFSGENAEAYWAFDGRALSLQARQVDDPCDRIGTMQLRDGADADLAKPSFKQLSSGAGATTCAHFFPNGREVLYASTHLGGAACPPKPDMRQGYVWALYESYDIFKASLDEPTKLTRLTDSPGYDAEGTVCGKDGSILFTSVRDGDLELYRMNADGSGVTRLTFTPGYDGGAFFNRDCTKIVWRASRPKPGKELDDYTGLLKQGLVRPSKLELYVANADGSEPHQVTYLNAASFAPFFFPDGKRILFSSNVGDPKGRDFDIWAIDVDGSNLERITHTPGFDGFPMFSPDGTMLAFSSNRRTAEGKNDTNLFLARWVSHPPKVEAGPAERIRASVEWLAAPERLGRASGTDGSEAAGAWVESQFQKLGLQPLGHAGTFRDGFPFATEMIRGEGTRLSVAGKSQAAADLMPFGFSARGSASGRLVLAGHGVRDEALGIDDYRGLDVKGAVVVVRRFAPTHPKLDSPEAQRRAGDVQKKAFVAKSLGAKALLVVDWQEGPPAAEATLPALTPPIGGDAGLPVAAVTRKALEAVWPKLLAKKPVTAEVVIQLESASAVAFNVVGRLPGTDPTAPVVVLGAHYDHLGMGGPGSLAPDKVAVHPGADDNASGVAALLETAAMLTATKRAGDVVLIAFSGEERGLLGSSELVSAKPEWLARTKAMINFDMVGRLRRNTLSVLGAETASEWKPVIDDACAAARLSCVASGDGYGPSDHLAFHSAGLPVLHLFTGAHGDYHKPTDTPDLVNVGGAARIALAASKLVDALQPVTLTLVKTPQPVQGDARSFNASLGTVPNYQGPPAGVRGVLLDDVRPGGGAARAGMKRGDVIQKLGRFDVSSVEDLMFVLMQAKPGETVTAVVLRDGAPLPVEVTYQEGKRR